MTGPAEYVFDGEVSDEFINKAKENVVCRR